MTYTIKDCREKEFYAYGTTRIFEKRANVLRTLRTWITFLGIVVPVIIGGLVLTFGQNAHVLPIFIVVAGVVGLMQLTLSTWSIVARWDEKYEYAVDSSRHNTEIFNAFKRLADAEFTDREEQYKEAMRENEAREFKDIGQGISDKERRYAYRESLKYYQKPCYICNIVPKTVKPSKCDACGNF